MNVSETGHKLISAASSLAAAAAGLVYDSRCPTCGGKADNIATFPICRACMQNAAPYTGPACRLCAKPFASKYSETCGDCLASPPEFSGAMSYGLYEGALMDAIHALKFAGTRRLARPLGRMLCTLDLPDGLDAIVPVPMTPGGLRQRGFNQSALLARGLARQKGIPLELHLLEKIKETPAQVGLSRRLRMRNIRGAFAASGDARGRSVLLVDDVITTGATARECASALMRAGAVSVFAISLARTY